MVKFATIHHVELSSNRERLLHRLRPEELRHNFQFTIASLPDTVANLQNISFRRFGRGTRARVKRYQVGFDPRETAVIALPTVHLAPPPPSHHPDTASDFLPVTLAGLHRRARRAFRAERRLRHLTDWSGIEYLDLSIQTHAFYHGRNFLVYDLKASDFEPRPVHAHARTRSGDERAASVDCSPH